MLVTPVLLLPWHSIIVWCKKRQSEDAGETVALVSRAGVSAVLCSSAPLPACLHSTRSTSLSCRTLHTAEELVALRISSECTVDVCAEINAAAPPDQQSFPVSCEVTGLPNEKRYCLWPGAGVFPVSSDRGREAEAGKANTRISSDSWRDLRLVS